MRIDFFIAGVQKSGTTALDTMLRRRPGVQMASSKEPHMFDNEGLDWSEPDYALLHRCYDWTVAGVLRGEATPIYTYWPNSIERIYAYNPHAKLIVGLRHPVYRAFSHWRMETTRNHETLPFHQAIREGRARVHAAAGGVHRIFSYVERGCYAAQVDRVLSWFPRSQVLFFRTDRLWREPGRSLHDICAFLGVREAPEAAEERTEYIAPLFSADFGALEESDRADLMSLFESDIVETSRITGLALDDWLDAEYREPMDPSAAAEAKVGANMDAAR